MKKIILLPILIIIILTSACMDSDYSDVWSEYAEWRTENDNWLLAQADLRNDDGTLYYSKVTPAWNDNAYVLMHFFNDTEETQDNLVPLYTSTVSVKYIGRLYDDTVFDSSYTMTDSIYTFTPSEVISGWQIALANMHVGDTCEVIIPYEVAYYYSGSGLVLPFSCLKFNMRLVDIPYYEVKP